MIWGSVQWEGVRRAHRSCPVMVMVVVMVVVMEVAGEMWPLKGAAVGDEGLDPPRVFSP